MSFSRNFIRGLIENVTDEQIRALIDEHMESVTALQGKVTSVEQERDKFKAEAAKVVDLEKQIDDKEDSIRRKEAVISRKDGIIGELLRKAGVI